MRKVTLKVKAKVLIPLILTYNVTAKADEGVPMERIAKAAIKGKVPDGVDIDDSSFEITSVDGADETQVDQQPLEEQITEYLESEDAGTPIYQSHEVEDSR